MGKLATVIATSIYCTPRYPDAKSCARWQVTQDSRLWQKIGVEIVVGEAKSWELAGVAI